MAEVVVKISKFISEEPGEGQPCTVCKDCIYGTAFRVVISATTDRNPLPKFSPTNIILCASCKSIVEW